MMCGFLKLAVLTTIIGIAPTYVMFGVIHRKLSSTTRSA
tara:strand:- start:807 stop:923 length:117 start_codon:yes stop_codon:yes gene_type:complete